MCVAIDVALFAAAAYDVPGQASWRVRIGGPYLLGLGGIAPEDGSIDLLEAYATLAQEHPSLADLRLAMTGPHLGTDADYQDEFWARAAELGVDPVALGVVSDVDLPPLVAGASAAAYLPTGDVVDGRPFEALAAGVPVVARDLPALRAALRDTVLYGDTVLSIADALVDVLTVPPEPRAGVELAASYAVGAAGCTDDTHRPTDGDCQKTA